MANESAVRPFPVVKDLSLPDLEREISNLLEARDNTKEAILKLKSDQADEELKSAQALASEAAKENFDNFVNKHKELEHKNNQFEERLAALEFFSKKFHWLYEEHKKKDPDEVADILAKKLQELKAEREKENSQVIDIDNKIKKIEDELYVLKPPARGAAAKPAGKHGAQEAKA